MNNVTHINAKLQTWDHHVDTAIMPTLDIPINAILPGRPASLANQFDDLLLPRPVPRKREIRPTWVGMFTVSTFGFLSGFLSGFLVGLAS